MPGDGRGAGDRLRIDRIGIRRREQLERAPAAWAGAAQIEFPEIAGDSAGIDEIDLAVAVDVERGGAGEAARLAVIRPGVAGRDAGDLGTRHQIDDEEHRLVATVVVVPVADDGSPVAGVEPDDQRHAVGIAEVGIARVADVIDRRGRDFP